MKWYAIIADGIILAIGRGNSCEPETEITEAEYNKLLSIIHNRPIPPDGYDYKLKVDTLEWELYEIPQEDEEEPNDT